MMDNYDVALAVMDDDGYGCAITSSDQDRAESPGDSFVPMHELRAMWTKLQARGELWNGMTDHHLRERYGDRLYHVMGAGWFIRQRQA